MFGGDKKQKAAASIVSSSEQQSFGTLYLYVRMLEAVTTFTTSCHGSSGGELVLKHTPSPEPPKKVIWPLAIFSDS